MRAPVFRAAALISVVVLATSSGCVHGDAIILRDVRGRVLDQRSGAPIPGAKLTATLWTDSAKHPECSNHGSTDDDGRFSIPVTIGGGTVNWIFFVPLFLSDWTAPRVQRARLVIERNGESAVVQRELDPRTQSTSVDQRPIDLGDLRVQLQPKLPGAPGPQPVPGP